MEAPDPRSTRLVVCPQANIPPELQNNNWTYAPGPNGPARDLTITITARDLDFNVGSHEGKAIITIDWGDYQTETFPVDMDNTWQTWSFSHEYTSPTWKTVKVYVDDNAPEEGNNIYVVKALEVDPTAVTCKAYTCP